MSETKIVWHPYPKEKPKITGTYIVMIESSCYGDTFEHLELAGWIGENFLVRNANFHKSGVIVAWMLLPEPFEEKENGQDERID